MPLFECSKCKTVDNTALGYYWVAQLDGKPALCTECKTGTWHGEFPKQTISNSDMVMGVNGYVYHAYELAPGGYFHGITKPVQD